MWELTIIALASFGAGFVTLFSGFGLGTILLPVFALFLPIPIAITATALVHLLNNIFKLSLVLKNINFKVVLRFGSFAVLAAFVGSFLLLKLESNENNLKTLIGVVIIFFALIELFPFFQKIKIEPKYMPIGGLFSGFFGGLSGHQGVFRSIFLLKSGLAANTFIATGVVIAVLVDLARLSIYGIDLKTLQDEQIVNVVIVAVVFSFIGSFTGNRLSLKITLSFIRKTVSVMMVVIGTLLVLQAI